DNGQVMYQDHTFHDMLNNQYYSMPKTIAICYYGDRVWALKNNYLAFSDAFPPTYYPTVAILTGDRSVFTGVTGETIKVTIDGTVYDNIAIGTAITIADVITAINAIISGT